MSEAVDRVAAAIARECWGGHLSWSSGPEQLRERYRALVVLGLKTARENAPENVKRWIDEELK
jgi:hypothetical protein